MKNFYVFGYGRPEGSPAIVVDFTGLEGEDFMRAYGHAYDFCPFGGNPGYSYDVIDTLEEVQGEYVLYKATPFGLFAFRD